MYATRGPTAQRSMPTTSYDSNCLRMSWHTLQHWGYYYSALTPAAVVNSGDTIVVETSTQHGGDDYDKIVRGDPGMEVGGLAV